MGIFAPFSFMEKNVVSGGIPIQPEATAFLTATGITDPTISAAINELVYDLKGAGVWSNMVAIYPFVGGTATTHKYNLIDPRDLDAAFRLTFNGVSHSANGITNGGASNNAAYTRVNIQTDLSQNDAYIAIYSGTSAAQDGIDMAAISGAVGIQLNVRALGIPDKIITKIQSGTAYEETSNTDGSGFYQVSRTSSTGYTLQKNTTQYAKTRASSSPPNEWIAIGGLGTTQTTSVANSTRNYRYSAIGAGLTTTQMDNHYTAVQKFQTALGRNV